MDLLRRIEVVKQIVHLCFELHSSPDDPAIISTLKERGFFDDEIEAAMDKIKISGMKNGYSSIKNSSPLRTMNEVERQYLTKEVQQFIHQLQISNMLTRDQIEEIINYLVAIANKPLTLEDVRILLKEYFVENNHFEAFWFFLFDKVGNSGQKLPAIH